VVGVESLTDFPGDRVASAHRNKGRGHGRRPVHRTRLSQVLGSVTTPHAAKHQAEVPPRPWAGR
jgi:hypothetical protein